jgi:hypothetical protein
VEPTEHKEFPMFKTNFSTRKYRCPECGSESVYKSHRRGILERMVLGLTKMRPYRCRECYERFYGKDYDLTTKLSTPERHAEPTGQQAGLNTLTAQPRS